MTQLFPPCNCPGKVQTRTVQNFNVTWCPPEMGIFSLPAQFSGNLIHEIQAQPEPIVFVCIFPHIHFSFSFIGVADDHAIVPDTDIDPALDRILKGIADKVPQDNIAWGQRDLNLGWNQRRFTNDAFQGNTQNSSGKKMIWTLIGMVYVFIWSLPFWNQYQGRGDGTDKALPLLLAFGILINTGMI